MGTRKEVMGWPLPGENRVGTPGPCRMRRHHDARSHGESRECSRSARGTSRAFDRHTAHAGRGFLLPGILLLLAEEPSHGYTLSGRLMEMGIVKMAPPPPIVYRALHRLDREGLAVSNHVDEEGKGPARKVYRLTDAGWKALSEWSDQLKETSKGIEEFQGRYASVEKNRQQSPEDDSTAG